MFDLMDPFNVWVEGNFARAFPEVQRYKTYSLKDGTSVLLVNTVGVNKDDLKVELTNDELSIKGATENKELNEKNSVNYTFDIARTKDIEKMKWCNRDGYTYVYFYYKKPATMKISYKDDDEG